MSINVSVQEACPNCKTLHVQESGKDYREGGKTVYAYPDILCACGCCLRWVVPFFKVTESGFCLRLKYPNEKARG